MVRRDEVRFIFLFVLLLTMPCVGVANQSKNRVVEDPLDSSQWQTMHAMFLQDHPVVFDPRITILAPEAAENALEVPVWVDASAIESVQRIVLFADFNPIAKILEYEPGQLPARIGFRFKIQQASPVRAAVLDDENIWRVNGVWIDAAGGGCTLPSVGSGSADWASRLGEIYARQWPRETTTRLRFQVVHPMDTGLAGGIPAFYIDSLTLSDPLGQSLAILKPYEPIAENPVFSIDLPHTQPIRLSGRDNNGNTFQADVMP